MVFSGYNQRAVISFIRTLHETNCEYAIIVASQDDPIFLSEYTDRNLAVRQSKPLIREDLLHSIQTVQSKVEADEYIIAPVTEALNRFLLEIRSCFEQQCTIPLVDKNCMS